MMRPPGRGAGFVISVAGILLQLKGPDRQDGESITRMMLMMRPPGRAGGCGFCDFSGRNSTAVEGPRQIGWGKYHADDAHDASARAGCGLCDLSGRNSTAVEGPRQIGWGKYHADDAHDASAQASFRARAF